MYDRPVHIIVDGESAPCLDHASDFTAFSIRSSDPTRDAVLLALSESGSPAPEDDHVFVDVEAVRAWALASGAEPEVWEVGYAKMLAYAGSNGWMNDDGTAIKAHIEAR